MPPREPLNSGSDVNVCNLVGIFFSIFLLPGKKLVHFNAHHFWSLI